MSRQPTARRPRWLVIFAFALLALAPAALGEGPPDAASGSSGDEGELSMPELGETSEAPLAELDPAVSAELMRLEALAEERPDDPIALADYGSALVRVGRVREGLAVLTRAHAISPEEPLVSLARARALLASEQFEEAERAALATANSPLTGRADKAEAFFIAGSIRMRIGDSVESESLLREALLLDPKHVRALFNLGVLYMGSRRPGQGIQALQAAAKAAYDDAGMQGRIAAVLEGYGRPDLSGPMRARAAELVPDNAGARYLNARALLRERRLAEAADELEAVVKLQPERTRLKSELAQIYLTMERFDEARRHAEAALAEGDESAAGLIETIEERTAEKASEGF